MRRGILLSWLFRAPFVTGDACETGWKPVRVLVHVRIASQGIRSDCCPAKGCAFPNTSGAFHRWNRMAEGIAPWTTRQDLFVTRPCFRFCNVERPRLFYRSSSPEADCPRAWFRSARRIHRGVIHNFSAAAPLRLLCRNGFYDSSARGTDVRELREALCQTLRARSTK